MIHPMAPRPRISRQQPERSSLETTPPAPSSLHGNNRRISESIMRFRLQGRGRSLHLRNHAGGTVPWNGPPSSSSAERLFGTRSRSAVHTRDRGVGDGEWTRHPCWLVGPVGRVSNRIDSRSLIHKLAAIALTGNHHIGVGESKGDTAHSLPRIAGTSSPVPPAPADRPRNDELGLIRPARAALLEPPSDCRWDRPGLTRTALGPPLCPAFPVIA